MTEARHRVFFFGCAHGGGGHRLHGSASESCLPWKLTEIDGRAQPNSAIYAHTWQVPEEKQPLGVARLHHRAGWTMLSFWDRSMDKRFGSNGNFIIEGTHTFAEACRLASEAWPESWLRITTQPGWPSHAQLVEVAV
ncbi:MAG: hypothetical protein EKK60_13835 [Gordonia sp. (in: high G+C Gram-positive bacteria)]|nr:MAG: hypothetical protein EKK60_13835 [Gordonia sp. (in: high G+C Gram-positive bacteria)]